MSDARLAGIEGRGTLQVWRGQKHDVLGILGTWRPVSKGTDDEELRELLLNSEPLFFDGPLDDRYAADTRRLHTEVHITSINSYSLETSEDGATLFVNFAPVDPEGVTH